MTELKTHFAVYGLGRTLCDMGTSGIDATTEQEDVTCKRCLYRLRQKNNLGGSFVAGGVRKEGSK